MKTNHHPTKSFMSRLLHAVFSIVKNNFDWRCNGVNHFRKHINLNRYAFDTEYYLEHNPDIIGKIKDPFEHFINHGLSENRTARFFDTQWYLKRYPDLLRGHIDTWAHYKKLGDVEGRSAQFLSFHATVEGPNHRNYKEWVSHFDRLDDKDVSYLKSQSNNVNSARICAVIFPINGFGASASLASVLAQGRSADEIFIIEKLQTFDQADTGHGVDDNRIKRVVLAPDEPIASGLNRVIRQTCCDFLTLVPSDGSVSASALYWISKALEEAPLIDIIYSDEDRLDDDGERVSPNFKPKPNFELMLTHDAIGNLATYRLDLLKRLEGFDAESGEFVQYDLTLRAIAAVNSDKIMHIPRVLFHRHSPPEPVATSEDHLNVVRRHLALNNLSGAVTPAPDLPGYSRVSFDLPTPLPRVSIIIPTRDRLDILKVCIGSLFARTTYSNFEVIVVDNGSVESETRDYLQKIQAELGVVVIRDPRPFNFSILNNLAVEQSTGEFVCLMNNDIEILTPGWLEEMLSFAILPGVGCVGCRLWYPDGTIQHAGILIGFHGVAGHLHKGLKRGDHGFGARASLHQTLSAVTAACLVVRKSTYQEVGGFDEALAVSFNDVDFCLKVRASGRRNVFTPYADMTHHESASRGRATSPKAAARELSEINLIKSRWNTEAWPDPSYNPNLTLILEDFSYAWPPRVQSVAQLRKIRWHN